MYLTAILAAGLVVAAMPAASQTAVELSSRATMTAAGGTITDTTFTYGGTDRYYCTYMPTSLGPGTVHPLVIALHGGDGNASQMMEDNHGIIAKAEALGWIVVFPNGLPRPSCSGSLCVDNNWSAPENVFFLADVIDRLEAGGQIDADRVHLIGFSGGAALIYTVAATVGFPHAINSVATVAGIFGAFNADRPNVGFRVVQLQVGSPVNAILVQGGSDPKVPVAGGLDGTTREAHTSFRTKVDAWRLVTGTEQVAAQPIDVPALTPTAPVDVDAQRDTQGNFTVVEVLDHSLGHAWPNWDIMALVAELFEGR